MRHLIAYNEFWLNRIEGRKLLFGNVLFDTSRYKDPNNYGSFEKSIRGNFKLMEDHHCQALRPRKMGDNVCDEHEYVKNIDINVVCYKYKTNQLQ